MHPSAFKLVGSLIACALFSPLAISPAAQAQEVRRTVSIGGYINQSAAIAVAQAKKSESADCQSVLELGEFLKGQAAPIGRGLCVPKYCAREAAFCGRDFIRVPPDSGQVVAFLRKGWENAPCPLLDVFRDPREIAAVRAIVKVNSLPTERARLEALRALAYGPNPLFRQELFPALKSMGDPANFPLVTDLFDKLDAAGQAEVVGILEWIGDPRGIPTLIKALHSPDKRVRLGAVQALANHFRGFPGVEEPLRKVWDDSQPKSSYQQAEALWEDGHRDRAHPLELAVALDPGEGESQRLHSALRLVPSLSPSERGALQPAIRPLFAHLDAPGDYLSPAEKATILRAFATGKDLDSLIPLLALPEADSSYQCAPCIATMAIRELGPEARRSAAERLLARRSALSDGEALALYWIADGAQPGPDPGPKWKSFLPLAGVGRQQDEGMFLIRVLRSHPDLPQTAQKWIAFRLGDLKEQRSVKELIGLFQQSYRIHNQLSIVPEALTKIGSPEVEAEVTRLLASLDPEIKDPAMDILCGFEGTNALPLLRKALAGDDPVLRSHALYWMGYLGKPEDLKTLVPLADFWTGDHANHYWAALAVSEIRSRNHIRGPLNQP